MNCVFAAGTYSIDMQAKNFNADLTNPNMYYSINKEDHVYDEIKHKYPLEERGIAIIIVLNLNLEYLID